MPPQNLPGETPTQPAPTFQGSNVVPPVSAGHPFLPLLIVLIVLIVGGAFFFFRFPLFVDQPQGQGSLYLGLAPINSSKVQLYTYDLGSKELVPVQTGTDSANSVGFSNDGALRAFVGWQDVGNSQVYVSSLATNTLYLLTKDSLSYKRLPRWSPDDQRIAFTATTIASPATLADWSGYVVDREGITHRISSGAYPDWLTDNEGVILRTDGLYLFNLAEKHVVRVIPTISGDARFNMRIAVSPDKKRLAWSMPDNGSIQLYDITSLTPVTLENAGVLESHSFWVEFSPDSSKLAAQEVEWNALNTNPRPRIVIFDLESKQKETVLDLSSYNQQYMFLSEWK